MSMIEWFLKKIMSLIYLQDYSKRFTGSFISCDFGGIKISRIFSGMDTSFFLTEEKKLWSCGWAADGQTGHVSGNVCLNYLK